MNVSSYSQDVDVDVDVDVVAVAAAAPVSKILETSSAGKYVFDAHGLVCVVPTHVPL